MFASRRGFTGIAECHLGNRATEVHVDVVDVPFADEPFHSFANVVRVDAVELQASRGFLLAELREHQRLGSALHQRPRRDHLAHVEPGAELTTDRSKRPIGHTGHRREHDRRPD